MKSLVQKDKSLRQKFLSKELNQKILVYSFRKLLNTVKYSKKKKNFFSISLFKKFKKITSKTKIVRRCILTGRSRSSLRILGFSRIKIKELIRDRRISNISKKSW
jgi:ribosomal protein S14